MTGEYPKCSQCGTHHPPEPEHCPQQTLFSSPRPLATASLDPKTTTIASPSGTIKPDDRIGRIVDDRFTITGVLGEGGFATVYKAKQHSMDDRVVALKMLHPKHAKDPSTVKRFLEEVKTVSALDVHDNIVTVHAAGKTSGGEVYLAMERLRGQTLEDILKSSGPVSLERALSIAIDICKALAVLHANGIIHRDIKPANIMVMDGQEGQPVRAKLLDFGIARVMHTESGTLTQVGQVVGSPRYMSPEQITGGEVKGSSDIYSLGLVLFEMLLGAPPFTKKAGVPVQIAHLKTPPPHFADVNPDISVPPAIEDLILETLSKNPNGRPSTATDLSQLLRDNQDTVPGQPPAYTKATKDTRGSSGVSTRGMQIMVGMLAALIAVALVMGWYYVNQTAASACTEPFMEIETKAEQVLSDFREALEKPPLSARSAQFRDVEHQLKSAVALWKLEGQKFCQQGEPTRKEEDDILKRRHRAIALLVIVGDMLRAPISDQRLGHLRNDLEDKVRTVAACSHSRHCSRQVASSQSRGAADLPSQVQVTAKLTCRRPTSDGTYETLTNCLDHSYRPTDEFRVSVERTPDIPVYGFQSDAGGHFNAMPSLGVEGSPDSAWRSFGDSTKADALRIQVVADAGPTEWLERLRGAPFQPIEGTFGPEVQAFRTQLTVAQLDAKTDMSDTPDVDDSIAGTGTGLAVVDITLERETTVSP